MQTFRLYILLLILLPVRAQCQQGDPALIAAVRKGGLETVSSLVAAGVNVNVVSPDGYTPLLLAAENGNVPIARILVQHGADVNFQKPGRGAAIHLAVEHANFDLIRVLAASGADLDLARSDGMTPLHVAAIDNRWGESESLMQMGANKESEDAQGDTPIHLCVLAGKIEPFRSMLVMGANLEAKNRSGQTVLESAQARGFNEAVAMINRYQNSKAQREAMEANLKNSGLNLQIGFNAWNKDKIIAGQVYSNSLDGGPGALGLEWSTRPSNSTSDQHVFLTVSPNGAARFLGEFGNQPVFLRLSKLPAHKSVSIQFDLLICGLWMGDHFWNGPSHWSFGLEDGLTILDTSFLNGAQRAGYKLQSYPANYPGGQYEAWYLSKEHNTLGYGGQSTQSDAIYHLAYTFDSAEPSLNFVFQAAGLLGIDRASWGLKNVEVTLGSPATAKPVAIPTPKPAAAAPKPASTTAVHKASIPTKSASKPTHKIARKTHSTPTKKKTTSTAANKLHDKKKALTP